MINDVCVVTLKITVISERHIKPEEIGLEEPRGVTTEGRQPFLVAFFKSGPNLGSTDLGTRRKREARRLRNHSYSENYVKNPLAGMLKI